MTALPLLEYSAHAPPAPLHILPPAPRRNSNPALANRLHRQLTNMVFGDALYLERHNHQYWLAYTCPDRGWAYYALYHSRRQQKAEMVGVTRVTHEIYAHVTRRAIAEYLAERDWQGATVWECHPFALRSEPLVNPPVLTAMEACERYWIQVYGLASFRELWLMTRLLLLTMERPRLVERIGEATPETLLSCKV